jgi:hypothetical protein
MMMSQAQILKVKIGNETKTVIRDLVLTRGLPGGHYRVRLAGTSKWFKDMESLIAAI